MKASTIEGGAESRQHTRTQQELSVATGGLLLILLLAALLRVYRLDFQSLWSDEGISLLRSSLPLGEMLQTMPVEHAPGYFLLLALWLPAAGASDFALRFLSVWPSVLAVALAFRLAADMGSRRAGLAAALLLAVNPFQVWYAQEARMYSWLLAAALGSTWMLWKLLSGPRPGPEQRNSRWWPVALGYSVLTAATIYLHHYGFLVPLGHTIYALILLTWTGDRRRFARWLLGGAGVVVLYLPWLPRLLGVFGFSGWRPPVDPWQLPWRYLTAYTVGDAMPTPWRTWLPWIYLALALIGLWGWWRHDRRAGLLLALSTVVPLAAALALALRQPDFHERYTSFMSAPLLMLVAGSSLIGRGRASARRCISPALLLGSLLLAGLVTANGAALHRHYTDTSLHKPDFRSAAARIEQNEQPGDVILVDGPDPQKVFLHYYRGSAPVHDLRELAGADAQQVNETLAGATAGRKRAWSLLYFHDPGPVQSWLARYAWPTPTSNHNGILLTLYGLPGAPGTTQPANVVLGSELTLAETTIASGEAAVSVRAGDLLRVTTVWQVHSTPPSRKFSLRLQDAAGRIWQADDYIPQDGFAPTEHWLPGQPATDLRGVRLPADLPPGDYQLTLRLYDPATGIPVETTSGPDVTLAALSIAAAPTAPDPASLQMGEEIDVSLGGGLRLLGSDATPTPLRVGREGTLSLWWRVDEEPVRARQIRIRILDRRGSPVFQELQLLSPLALDGPAWEKGQILRERYRLGIDPSAASGRYRLEVALTDSTGALLGEPRIVATAEVEARPRSYRLPQIAHKLDIRLGDAVSLKGFDLAVAEGPGKNLHLTLYWQATGRVQGHHKVFVHVLNEAGDIATQSDTIPAAGEAPTETWLPNEVVIDGHTLQVPQPGRYRLFVGMYDPVNGQRMPVTGEDGLPITDNAVMIEEIVIPVTGS